MANFTDPGKVNETDISVISRHDREKSTHGISGFFPAIVSMIAEDGESFFQYLKTLGLSRENNLVVLSSRHHYYYDENELRNVKTLINLRKLNLIKYLDEFLFTLVQVLPPDTRFIGCFTDYSALPDNTSLLHPVRFLKKKINSLDFSGEKALSREKVSEILESHGFTIINMTEMNGRTYFCSRRVKNPASLRA